MGPTDDKQEFSPLRQDDNNDFPDRMASREPSVDSQDSADSGISTNSSDSGGSANSTTPLIKNPKPGNHSLETNNDADDNSTRPLIKKLNPGNHSLETNNDVYDNSTRPLIKKLNPGNHSLETNNVGSENSNISKTGNHLRKSVDSGFSDNGGSDNRRTTTGSEDVENQPYVGFNKGEDAVGADSSFWIKIVVIFSVLDILLFATIFTVWFGLPRSDIARPEQTGHCLNCTDVYLTPDDKIDNIYNFTIHEDMCCSVNETLLIQKYVIKRYRSDQAKASAERVFPERTAIHLDLDREDENSVKEGTDQVLKWTRSSLMYGDLSLSQDQRKILVGRTGLYYISPRVVFDDKEGDTSKPDLDPMTVEVHRDSESGGQQLLLESKETHCAHSKTKCSKPSGGQGVFRMEKGDSVLVKVTKPCGLVLQDKLNHFDMYMI